MSPFTKFKFFLKYFGFFQVAMIGWTKPKLIELDDKHIVIKIPLNRRTRNHLKSMYFSALAIGADVAGGMHGFYHAKKANETVLLVFKSFQAQFLKRPEHDVYFVCDMGEDIKTMITDSKEQQKRMNKPITIKAYCNYTTKPDLVADFTLELSIKTITK